MEASDGSSLQSVCMIRAAELFPKPTMEKEHSQLPVPFHELPGEAVKYLDRTDDGLLALSNYRLFLFSTTTRLETSVPLGLIENAQTRDLFHLVVQCKDASTVKCSFATAEQCAEWQRQIQNAVALPETLESLFAFPFYAWMCESLSNIANNTTASGDAQNASAAAGLPMVDYVERLQRDVRYDADFMAEVERLGFDLKGSWRISEANKDFKLCASYPTRILVPCCISDETLHSVANFRGSRRLPAVVWRHRKSGAVIARCSQPEVGWLGWRNAKDEQLLQALADACAFDRGEQSRLLQQMSRNNSNGDVAPMQTQSTPATPDDNSQEEVTMDDVRKILIVDARSYTSAVTNRARGGGCECIEYYPCAEIEFMNLGNIHVIRKSFQSLRQLCASPPDVPNWLGLLEKTMWLQHLSGLLSATITVCHAIEKKGRPVLVHCSDGWDRTPQIVATAELCLDPYYRTVDGFRVLVEKEWLSYGHKFSDRCGNGPGADEGNERCPVFLQWLDVVHQIHRQFPCYFEFSMGYLIKLAQHSLSCLFGTFFCNTLRERLENTVFERTFSVWPFLSGPQYRNPLYVPNREKVLWPKHNVRDLNLWNEVYLGSLGNQHCDDFAECSNTMAVVHGNENMECHLNKTRSYGDLMTAGLSLNGMSRRSSDPNVTLEPNLSNDVNSENNSITDTQSENEDHEAPLDIDARSTKVYNELTRLETFVNNNNNIDHEQAAADGLEEKEIMTISSRQYQVDDCDSSTCEKLDEVTAQQKPVSSTLVSTATSALQSLQVNGSFVKNPTLYSQDETDYLNSDVNRITIHKLGNMNLLHNVDLEDETDDDQFNSKLLSATNNGVDIGQQQLWHGSIQSSTDTLVPIESKTITPALASDNTTCLKMHYETDYINSAVASESLSGGNHIAKDIKRDETPRLINHNSTNDTTTTTTNSSQSIVDATIINDCNHQMPIAPAKVTIVQQQNANNSLAESIIILPEYQKLDISVSGKCEMVPNTQPNANNHMAKTIATATTNTPSSALTSTNPSSSTSTSTALTMLLLAQAQAQTTEPQISRRRTSSSNSRRDGQYAKQISNHSTMSRFSLTGVRSLPITPSGLQDRPQIAISCPDGLAHGLSEQNIRLQQLVHEHKLREDVLLREINAMRLTLLKKTCPACSNGFGLNDDEPCSAMDNVENTSICSWEAVEDRSGPSSCTTSSSIPQQSQQSQHHQQAVQQHLQQHSINANNSVLWVPDHAVSRCTTCQTEFWLGRRRHHCRSCGQIFCADCSEFWAPLPEEKLLSPVRLCGPCYLAVSELPRSTLLQLQQEQQQQQQQQQHHHHHHNQQQQQQRTSNVTTSKA